MAPISLDELLIKIPNKFNLVMVAAKRARQIKDGAPRLVVTQSVNPVTIALEEISAGKIVLEGGSAHVMDDFGRPIRDLQESRLDELLAMPEETPDGTRGRGSLLDDPLPEE